MIAVMLSGQDHSSFRITMAISMWQGDLKSCRLRKAKPATRLTYRLIKATKE